MKRTKIIEELVKNINLENINYKIIKNNILTLHKIYIQLNKHWKKYNSVKLILKNKEFAKINNIITHSILSEYETFCKQLENIINIIHIHDSNFDFYYVNLGNYENDIETLNNLFNQTICLAKFANTYNTEINYMVIWIPININRDFIFEHVNAETINISTANFNAFTASGVTFGNNPRISIVSRYEEISKLLLHELIHGFNLDGSNFHSHNKNLIKEHKNIKNPENYDYDYSIYESYTELLSTYFSVIFRNIDIGEKFIMERLETEILIELLYSYNTIATIIKLNNYKKYSEFCSAKKFNGNICIYEYYFLKCLMYNNYVLLLCNSPEEYCDNYKKIININTNDGLLEDVFNNSVKQTNFRYSFYD